MLVATWGRKWPRAEGASPQPEPLQGPRGKAGLGTRGGICQLWCGGSCLALLYSQGSQSVWENQPKVDCLDEMHPCSPCWEIGGRGGAAPHFCCQARGAFLVLFWSLPDRRDHSEGANKNSSGGVHKGLQTCQSVLVLSESNPDFLGNDYLKWMISARGLK